MLAPKLYKVLLWIQGGYTTLTALWGLADIDSFMAITGPKTDVWLVKTASVVLMAIGLTLISYVFIKTDPLPAIILGILTSGGLAVIDFYYSGRGVISQIYSMDGVAEVVFALVWLYLLGHRRLLQRT
jgi:hypothetical protein